MKGILGEPGSTGYRWPEQRFGVRLVVGEQPLDARARGSGGEAVAAEGRMVGNERGASAFKAGAGPGGSDHTQMLRNHTPGSTGWVFGGTGPCRSPG